ncbi:MAG: hypothetical protein KME25_21230 [Symplocastrum torsivum CPER-KK1]|jgi:hypothetical protein|uniref:Uncharacterized protein n=1 Tax=Symplocastrum torsivum CPER-KK1 TaxID=450513 RepID=A0A951PPF5_9CYAN|nr:hypothetical protein [Symplocastrum torsivum CPER-KK1]
MKELQAGIQRIQAKCIPLNRNPVSEKKPRKQGRSHPTMVKAPPQQLGEPQRPLLSFPVGSSLEVLRKRMSKGMRRLESQAERINRLSAELEVAVLELKAIASDINRDWKAIQATQKSSTSTAICEYRAAVVPQVEIKSDGSFVLQSRAVDLFQAEREAALLAQTLRHRAKQKREHRSGK